MAHLPEALPATLKMPGTCHNFRLKPFDIHFHGTNGDLWKLGGMIDTIALVALLAFCVVLMI
jgi:hypothetical protein